MPVFWWMNLDLDFLVDRSTPGDVFWGVCGLIMILGSLSANRWGCVGTAQQQQYYREGAAGQEGGPQGARAGNRGPSEDSDDDEDEDEDEEDRKSVV